jgi:hypothetical protein
VTQPEICFGAVVSGTVSSGTACCLQPDNSKESIAMHVKNNRNIRKFMVLASDFGK